MKGLDSIQKYFDREGDDYDRYFQKRIFSYRSIGRAVGTLYGGKAIDGRLNAVLSLCGSTVEGKRILEVGCGPARYSIRLAERGAVATGIDFAPKMIHIARRHISRANLSDKCNVLLGDFITHDFAEQQFDISFATGVLDYIPPELRVPLLTKMKTLSTEFLVVSFPKKYVLHALLRKIWLSYKKVPVFFYTQKDINEIFEKAGLHEIDDVNLGILVVKKATAL